MFSKLETSVLTLLTWFFVVPYINCHVDCVDIVDMGKRCLLKSEYFSYKSFGAIAYVDIVDVVDKDFSVLRPKKCCLLTVLTLLTWHYYLFKTRHLCVDIVDMHFSGAQNKLSC